MKHVLLSLFVSLLLLGNTGLAAGANNRQLVLVTYSTTGVTSLSTSEIHKLFLGLPVEKEGRSLEAIINRSDPLLYEIFLQKVVYMSSMAYDRHLLANVIQLGGQRPRIFNDTQSLIRDLKQNPGTVTVLWDSDLKTTSNLTVLGEVWHGPVE